MPTTTNPAIPCKRPKVTVEPRPDGREFLVTCHVPGCGWQCPDDLQFVAGKSYAQEEATRHRRQHRTAVPDVRIEHDVEWDVYCKPCGGHRRTFGTRTDAQAWLDHHLNAEHGLVVCP
jgi:hypothetical protein